MAVRTRFAHGLVATQRRARRAHDLASADDQRLDLGADRRVGEQAGQRAGALEDEARIEVADRGGGDGYAVAASTSLNDYLPNPPTTCDFSIACCILRS